MYASGPQPRPNAPAARAKPRRDRNAIERLRDWVMDRGGAERAFANEYWDRHETGIYVEARTGEALFASTRKYDSGVGWPSFTRPLNPGAIALREDYTMGCAASKCARAKATTISATSSTTARAALAGQRFCINSCAIRFIPRDRMGAQGYGRYLPIVDGESAAAR